MFNNVMEYLRVRGAASIAAAALAVSVFSSTARAVIINPGDTATPTGIASPAFGAPVYTTGAVPFTAYIGDNSSLPVAFSGTLDTSVYTDPSTGDLDFVYQLKNNSSSANSVISFAAGSYSGISLTNADYITGTGTEIPAFVQRNTTNNGSSIDFGLTSGVAPGTTAATMIILTNTTNYSLNGVAALQGGANLVIPAPAPVPEPATAAIVGLSMIGLATRRRRV